jgi:hypothetical protein
MPDLSIAVISGASSSHFSHVLDTFRSVIANGRHDLNLCCLDVGLDAEQCEILTRMGVKLVQPEWDYPGEFPGPWFRAMTARPHLPRYFPGHDLYIWMDADCWLQNSTALHELIAAGQSHDVALVASIHQDYRQIISFLPDKPGPATQAYQSYLLQSLFPRGLAAKMMELPYLNGGTFAMRGNSPTWAIWREVLGPLYERARLAKLPAWVDARKDSTESIWKDVDNKAFFHAEEVALNFAAYQCRVAVLDATCNWLCSQRVPAMNAQGKFITPGYSATEIGIVHMSAKTKEGEFRVQQPDGSFKLMSLRYPAGTIAS